MDVYQINEKNGRAGWVGAFVLATEVKSWGIQGFVHCIADHDHSSRAYILLPFDQVDFIGKTDLVPADEIETELLTPTLADGPA